MLTLETVVKKTDNLLQAEMGEEMVMMSLENNAYYGFDKVGRVIWEMMVTPMSLAQIVEKLTDRFAVSTDQCFADILPFFEKLLAEGMIVAEESHS